MIGKRLFLISLFLRIGMANLAFANMQYIESGYGIYWPTQQQKINENFTWLFENKEALLGSPTEDGQVLASTAAGVRFWANIPGPIDDDYAGWNGNTTEIPSKDDIYDKIGEVEAAIQNGGGGVDLAGDYDWTGAHTFDGDVAFTSTVTLPSDVTLAHGQLATDALRVPARVVSADYTIGTDDPKESYGGRIYASAASTVTAPAISAGMSFRTTATAAETISLAPASTNTITLDGVPLDAGDQVTSPGTVGAALDCNYMAANSLYCVSLVGTWVDGGAAAPPPVSNLIPNAGDIRQAGWIADDVTRTSATTWTEDGVDSNDKLQTGVFALTNGSSYTLSFDYISLAHEVTVKLSPYSGLGNQVVPIANDWTSRSVAFTANQDTTIANLQIVIGWGETSTYTASIRNLSLVED